MVNAIARLPEDVRDQALDHCLFITIGKETGGFYVPVEAASDQNWIVVINEDWRGEDFESAVAHEIAHIALGHPAADLGLDMAKHEDNVAALVREWGFGGMGSLPLADRPD